MSTVFPFVEVPKSRLNEIGKPDAGSRIYRKHGPEEDMGAWFTTLTRVIGPSLSPGGVGMYCPVTRAAVHKRVKEGKLSMFLYHPSYATKSLLGKARKVRKSPYGYIPLSEVQAWRREIEERALKRGEITREELEGSKPDVDGSFLPWPVAAEREGLLDALREMGFGNPMDLARSAVRSWLGQGKGKTVILPIIHGVPLPPVEAARRQEAETELMREKALKKRKEKQK